MSEIRPLSSEALMTRAGARVDTRGGRTKTTTTVALDFGRITPDGDLVLHLFGTPGQQRFLPAWRDLAKGALGALALVDTRDPAASFDALGNLEDLDIPFAVAVNAFPGSPAHSEDDLRVALDLLPGTPLVSCEARDARSSVLAPDRPRTPSRPRRHGALVTTQSPEPVEAPEPGIPVTRIPVTRIPMTRESS